METMTETGKTEGKQEPASAGKGREIQKAASMGLMGTFEEMDRLFDNFMRSGWMRPWRFEWPSLPESAMPEIRMPKVDILDRDSDIVVRAEVPGVDKKDLDVSVGDNTVTIKGSTRREEKEEKGDFYRHEISTGAFSRSVALPSGVDGSKAKASFRDGMLELTLPKMEKTTRHSIRLD